MNFVKHLMFVAFLNDWLERTKIYSWSVFIFSDDTLDGTLTPTGLSGDEGDKSQDQDKSEDRSLVLSSKHRDDSDVSISSLSDHERPSRPSLVSIDTRVYTFIFVL